MAEDRISIKWDFNADFSGPVFDGRASVAAGDYSLAVRDEFADDLIDMIRTNLDMVLVHNRGIYTSHIHKVRDANDIVVTDRWIVYGPWLEGVGSRAGRQGTGEWPLTRWPGYHTFRRTAQQFNSVAEARAEAMLPYYLDRMNR